MIYISHDVAEFDGQIGGVILGMQFEVVQKGQGRRVFTRNVIYLHKDGWNDWFKYETMFYLSYVDEKGNTFDLGSVKIGQRGMEGRTPDLPSTFEALDDSFFTLGQSEDYYENIKQLEHGELREDILAALRDIAYNLKIFEAVKQEDVTRESLMRDISSRNVEEQFHRIATGGAKLTPFDIFYMLPGQAGTNYQLEFHVVPDSNPPTNIHVLIGRNGVGKTHMLRSMIRCFSTGNQNEQYGKFGFSNHTKFSNLVCVAFSPFDTYPTPDDMEAGEYRERYTYIGLGSGQEARMQRLEDQFIAALQSCNKYREKRTLWSSIITLLNSDPIFANYGVSSLLPPQGAEADELIASAKSLFSRLSSGHKVILLTLTCLAAITTERTFVLIDEPENHLHPPLLSAFVRALSALLIRKNGLAIISTHSPVILQEVPQSCVWQLFRNNTVLRAERPERETFGENVGVLMNDVFGLEVTYSGFHGMLFRMVEAGMTYQEILDQFDFQIGMEARSILRVLLANRENGGAE